MNSESLDCKIVDSLKFNHTRKKQPTASKIEGTNTSHAHAVAAVATKHANANNVVPKGMSAEPATFAMSALSAPNLDKLGLDVTRQRSVSDSNGAITHASTDALAAAAAPTRPKLGSNVSNFSNVSNVSRASSNVSNVSNGFEIVLDENAEPSQNNVQNDENDENIDNNEVEQRNHRYSQSFASESHSSSHRRKMNKPRLSLRQTSSSKIPKQMAHIPETVTQQLKRESKKKRVFSAKAFDDQTVQLVDIVTKYTVLVFWAAMIAFLALLYGILMVALDEYDTNGIALEGLVSVRNVFLLDSFVSCCCVYFSSKLAYKYYQSCICCKCIHYSWKKCCICNLNMKFRKRFHSMARSHEHVDTLVKEVKQHKKRQTQLQQRLGLHNMHLKEKAKKMIKNGKDGKETKEAKEGKGVKDLKDVQEVRDLKVEKKKTNSTVSSGNRAAGSNGSRKMSVVEEEPEQ